MSVQLACPSCNRTLRVPEELQAQPVQCPTCGVTFTAPAATAEPEPVAATPPSDEDEWEDEGAHGGPPHGVRRDAEPHRGNFILTAGIVGLVLAFVCWPVAMPISLAAWVMGSQDRAKMHRGVMDPRGQDLTKAGWICGIIGTCMNSAILLLCLGYFGLALALPFLGGF